MYEELEEAVHSVGALLFFLPPYAPDLNPIEFYFSLLKRYIQRHCNLAFHVSPRLCLEVAMTECTQAEKSGENLFNHCGYHQNELDISAREE